MQSVPAQDQSTLLRRPFSFSPWFRRPIFWALALGASSALFLLTVAQSVIGNRLGNRGLNLAEIVLGTSGELVVVLLLCLTTVQLGHLMPMRRGVRVRGLLAHLAASFVVACVGVALYSMWTAWTPPVLLPATLQLKDRVLAFFLGGAFQGIIVIYWSILGIQHAADYDRQLEQGRLRSARLEARLADARLAALRMQLQPHFLFNTLNAMSTLALRDGSRDTVQMISRLADFLRLTLDSDGEQLIPLDQELAFVRAYLAIEQARLGQRLQVSVEAETELLQTTLPNFALQPLVENAVQHGIADLPSGGRVALRALRRGDSLRVEVLDQPAHAEEVTAAPGHAANGHTTNGTESSQSGRGIGLLTTTERLRLIYGDQFLLALEPRDSGGTAAVLEIPLVSQAAQSTLAEALEAAS